MRSLKIVAWIVFCTLKYLTLINFTIWLVYEIIKENLATIGNSGNINHATGQFTLDKNKGIGAKVAYLPQAKLGLEYIQ